MFFSWVQLNIQSCGSCTGGWDSDIISFELLILICQSWHFYLDENHKFPRSFTTFQDLLRRRFGPLKTYSDVKFRFQPKSIWMILSRETITKKPFKKVVESRWFSEIPKKVGILFFMVQKSQTANHLWDVLKDTSVNNNIYKWFTISTGFSPPDFWLPSNRMDLFSYGPDDIFRMNPGRVQDRLQRPDPHFRDLCFRWTWCKENFHQLPGLKLGGQVVGFEIPKRGGANVFFCFFGESLSGFKIFGKDFEDEANAWCFFF